MTNDLSIRKLQLKILELKDVDVGIFQLVVVIQVFLVLFRVKHDPVKLEAAMQYVKWRCIEPGSEIFTVFRQHFTEIQHDVVPKVCLFVRHRAVGVKKLLFELLHPFVIVVNVGRTADVQMQFFKIFKINLGKIQPHAHAVHHNVFTLGLFCQKLA